MKQSKLDTPHIEDSCQETREKQPKLTEKQQGYMLLRQEGLTVADASQKVGMTRQNGYLIEKKLSKYGLKNTKMVKLACTAVRNIVQGLPVGQSEPPKPSTIIEAAKMIYDRIDPIQQDQSSPASLSFTQINCDFVNNYQMEAEKNNSFLETTSP